MLRQLKMRGIVCVFLLIYIGIYTVMDHSRNDQKNQKEYFLLHVATTTMTRVLRGHFVLAIMFVAKLILRGYFLAMCTLLLLRRHNNIFPLYLVASFLAYVRHILAIWSQWVVHFFSELVDDLHPSCHLSLDFQQWTSWFLCFNCTLHVTLVCLQVLYPFFKPFPFLHWT